MTKKIKLNVIISAFTHKRSNTFAHNRSNAFTHKCSNTFSHTHGIAIVLCSSHWNSLLQNCFACLTYYLLTAINNSETTVKLIDKVSRVILQYYSITQRMKQKWISSTILTTKSVLLTNEYNYSNVHKFI